LLSESAGILRRRVWFWVVILLVLIVQVPLILRVRWSGIHVTGVSLLPIGVAEVLVTLGAVRLVENFMAKFFPDGEA
jgi:hypothetical protein